MRDSSSKTVYWYSNGKLGQVNSAIIQEELASLISYRRSMHTMSEQARVGMRRLLAQNAGLMLEEW
jgi:hypothetical protein